MNFALSFWKKIKRLSIHDSLARRRLGEGGWIADNS